MTILNKEKILEVARAFIDEGKYDRAIREYEKLLLADPTDLRVKLRIAELYTKRKQITEAIRIYREVAEAYAAEGFFLKAVTVYKNILRLNPSLTEINEQLAILYERMGLVADAVRQYDILAAALDLKGAGDRVLEIRQRIVKLSPQDPGARVKLAELFQREKRMDEAIGQYEELARQLEESGGNQGKLADLYEKILSYRPDRHEMLRRLIDLTMELGDLKRALKWLEGGKELSERDPKLLSLMARIYASQNQNETARTKLVMLADLEAEAGNIDRALEAYCEILTLLPEEEDRVARRIEDLRAGALEEVVARARERREEREQEELLRNEKEATAQEAERGGAQTEPAKPPAKAAAPKPPPPPSPERETEGLPPQETMPAPLQEKTSMPSPPLLPPEPKGVPPRRPLGDAAFDLGIVYRRMGLNEEAAAELKKAQEIYSACRDAGVNDVDIPQRLAQIEATLAKGPVRAKEQPPLREETEPPRRAPPEKPKEPPEGKKKKVSFV